MSTARRDFMSMSLNERYRNVETMSNERTAVTARKTAVQLVREGRNRRGPDEAAERPGRRRDRQPDEPALVHDVDLDVEAREAAGAAHDEEKRDEEAGPPEVDEAPVVDEERGRHAEGHDVRERVELLAEGRRRPGQSGDAAVHAVEDRRGEDEHRGVVVGAPSPEASSERYPQKMLPAVKSAGST